MFHSRLGTGSSDSGKTISSVTASDADGRIVAPSSGETEPRSDGYSSSAGNAPYYPDRYPPSQTVPQSYYVHPPPSLNGYPLSSVQGYPPVAGQVYPPSSVQGYPPVAGQVYPPSSVQGYQPVSGQVYPPSSVPGYPPVSGQVYPSSSVQRYPASSGQGYSFPSDKLTPPNLNTDKGYTCADGFPLGGYERISKAFKIVTDTIKKQMKQVAGLETLRSDVEDVKRKLNELLTKYKKS
ncbi:hypothetical protein HAZT_HAZT001820 [Hyalella azteca]|uniref:Uncharacterized protein n=1 Tax=Hyalella azteca TaxID=294128 RepID=A0A6A0H494_HYAAZ|nr:hypothetical protein HAZT_HAZT001820 [Hyalella azteca]